MQSFATYVSISLTDEDTQHNIQGQQMANLILRITTTEMGGLQPKPLG
jgi:hypothetical protein